MTSIYKTIVIIAFALLIVAPLSSPAYSKAKPAAKSITFICKHCKNKISLKSKAGLTGKCTVCKCGLPMTSCQPNK